MVSLSLPPLFRDALHAPDMGVTVISINRITKALLLRVSLIRCQYLQDQQPELQTHWRHPGEHKWSLQGRACVRGHGKPGARQPSDAAHPAATGSHSPDAICALIGKGAVEGVQLIGDRTPLLCDSCDERADCVGR